MAQNTIVLTLPTDPDLERFRRDARRLQRAVRAGEGDAVALVSRYHPDAPDRERFPLAAAQLVVARSYGFTSWPRLRAYLRAAEEFGRNPTPAGGGEADELLTHACLSYDGLDEPARWAVAARMLARNPALTRQNAYVAAAAGDPEALATQLAADPRVARSDGGPWGWTALTYLTYSRIPQRDPIGAARLLLDAGADPAAGFLWHGLPTPFTVLTGCFGGGEAGSARLPAHPQGLQLAGLLLERGADPNDAQALYNRMFGDDDSHLELLLAAGLGRGDGGIWQRRLREALETPIQMVQRQVDWARDHAMNERLELLARHGFSEGTPTEAPSPWRRPDGARPYDRIRTPEAVVAAVADGLDLNALVDGRTLLHQAAFAGDVALVEALLAAGADPDVRDAQHDSTPLGWAEWARMEPAAAVLRDPARRRMSNRDAPDTPDPVG